MARCLIVKGEVNDGHFALNTYSINQENFERFFMIERTKVINDEIIFDHDVEMYSLIYSTAAKMYYPKEVNHRRKRESLCNLFKSKTPKYEEVKKLDKSLLKSHKQGYVVGEIFFKRCQMMHFMNKPPSLNKMVYAQQLGFFDKWGENLPVGSMKSLCKFFAPVLHFWAAYRYFQFSAEKNVEGYEPVIYCLLNAPLDFLKLATIYREYAFFYGVVKKRSDLWMPQDWKKAGLDWVSVDAFFETEASRKEAKKLKVIFKDYIKNEVWRNPPAEPDS